MWSIQTTEYYSALKRQGTLIRGTTLMNLGDSLQRERRVPGPKPGSIKVSGVDAISKGAPQMGAGAAPLSAALTPVTPGVPRGGRGRSLWGPREAAAVAAVGHPQGARPPASSNMQRSLAISASPTGEAWQGREEGS